VLDREEDELAGEHLHARHGGLRVVQMCQTINQSVQILAVAWREAKHVADRVMDDLLERSLGFAHAQAIGIVDLEIQPLQLATARGLPRDRCRRLNQRLIRLWRLGPFGSHWQSSIQARTRSGTSACLDCFSSAIDISVDELHSTANFVLRRLTTPKTGRLLSATAPVADRETIRE
jgi:hypothetical protein